jgi:DNA-binding beta-propeller fold protein YncE
MKNSFALLLFLVLTISCTKENNENTGSFLSGNGLFILNEGNFMAGNGSLSFFSYDSLKIYNDLFTQVNGRPLGDVPNSLAVSGERIYIVVNNSGKIEVIDKTTLESVKTITGLKAPRNIGIVSSTRAYVSSIYSDSLTIIDLSSNTVSGYINLKKSSEAISVIRNKAYVSNWVGGNKIMVINTDNNTVVDSVEVAMEPESMVIDNNKNLWVLCNGGWKREYFAELISINTSTNDIEKRLVFSDRNMSPSTLQIDGTGTVLYFICSGIYKLKTDASAIPATPFINENGRFFYKMGVNPVNGDIAVTDAVDFQQNGHLLLYKNNGTLIKDATADIIPSMVLFKLNPDFTE